MRRVLKGKRLLITGASSGIGRAIALEAARRGSRLLVTGRNSARLSETENAVTALGAEVHSCVADLAIATDRDRLMRQCEHDFGGLDILINNAGVGATGHFQYATSDRLRQIMEVNFHAPVELTRSAIPLLKSGCDPALLFVNSVAGRRAIPSRSEYSASKFALMGFSEALRAELSKDKIEVTVVNPGLTESSFEQNMIENVAKHSLHAQRSMSAEVAAQLILDALARRKHEATFTFKAKLLLLLNRLAPRFIDRKMSAFVQKLYHNQDVSQGLETPSDAHLHVAKT